MIALPAALVLAAILGSLWLLSVALRDASIIDVFWGPGFALVAGVCAATRGTALDPWRMLLLVMVTVWGLRLGLYLARRNLSREHLAARDGSGEDRRYQAMRARIGPRFWLISLGTVFALQGCLLFVVSLLRQGPRRFLGRLWEQGGHDHAAHDHVFQIRRQRRQDRDLRNVLLRVGAGHHELSEQALVRRFLRVLRSSHRARKKSQKQRAQRSSHSHLAPAPEKVG